MQDLKLWKVVNRMNFRELAEMFDITPQHAHYMSAKGYKVMEHNENGIKYIGLVPSKYCKKLEQR